jgi:hypothetical protein
MRKKWKYALADAHRGQEGLPRVEHGTRFGVFGRVCALTPSLSSQWLAPHDVRTGFYRYLKPGQPPNNKVPIMGKITAIAPMCKRGLRSGPSESRTDSSGDNS